MRIILASVLSFPIAIASIACSGDAYVSSTEKIDTFPEFEEASLVVTSPAPASVNYTELGLQLAATVVDVDGEPLEFTDITWTFAGDEEATFVGTDTVLDLEYGIYDLVVNADLPDGSRLQTNLPALRMQGERTGIYAGNLELSAALEFQGTPINTGCVGGMTFIVGMNGETIRGDGGCSMIVVIMDPIDVSYQLGGEVDGANAAGDIGLDLGFFDLPVGWEGGFDGEAFNAAFAGSAILFDFEGAINATRITEFVDE